MSKHSARIEALGSLDELNSFMGFLLSLSENLFTKRKDHSIKNGFGKIMSRIQSDLFVLGADLAQPLIQTNSIPHPLHQYYETNGIPAPEKLPQINEGHIRFLEENMDHFQSRLPPIQNFILPQGNPIGSFLQVVRAICRRTERRVVQLATHEEISPLILAYLNRLSDFLFVAARWANLRLRGGETRWAGLK